jgi:hypothetical protein
MVPLLFLEHFLQDLSPCLKIGIKLSIIFTTNTIYFKGKKFTFHRGMSPKLETTKPSK